MKNDILYDVITPCIGGTVLIGCLLSIESPIILFAISLIIGFFLLLRVIKKTRLKNDNNNQ
jgi:hypothetical protein